MTPAPSIANVALVGAGPGDPGLLTLRGAALLELADVVVYDYLANPLLLNHAPRAEKIYVGKQASRHAMTQDQINALLVAQAQRGRRVVRLKGGDPFVFGRGGEECEALAQARIPFEIVPGITAAIAAPAYAGIPVTHRNLNSTFTFITGHEKESAYDAAGSPAPAPAEPAPTDIDWPVIARLPAFAFYMGVKSLAKICARLIDHGKDPQTPAAAIQWGATPRQRTIVGTLATLPQLAAEAKLAAPAITIVGQVVKLRETLNWFESRPLFGKTVIVTRTRQQASALSEQLAALGAHVLEAPTIELSPPESWNEVDQALRSAGEYDWVVFTSANGVEAAARRLREIGLDARVFGQARLAAIGDATARAVQERLCLRVDLCPQKFVAEALADAFLQGGHTPGGRFLLLRADIARPILRERLLADGARQVDDISVYRTRTAGALPPHVLDAVDAGAVDWITFTSSSTARNFVELLGPERLPRIAKVPRASIGPITSQTLRELGLPPEIEAATHNIDGLVAALRGSAPAAPPVT